MVDSPITVSWFVLVSIYNNMVFCRLRQILVHHAEVTGLSLSLGREFGHSP